MTMRRLAGGVLLEPADLGIDALVVPVSSTVDGTIIAWRAAHAFKAVSFRWNHNSSPSTNAALMVRPVGIDGATFLMPIDGLWSGIDQDSVAYHALGDTDASAVGGVIVNNAVSNLMFPYVRFSAQNVDAVNGLTVSLSIMLLP